METNQTLTCSGANGGSFVLVYDGRTTHKLDHDATASEVQHALHSLPTLNEGDVRVETLHSAGSGLCGGDSLVIAFTTPLGNQPPLEIISSLLKNGAPGGVIDIQHTTGTRERLECNGAGFCDKAGNITIEFEATAPVLTQRGFLPFPNFKLRRRRRRDATPPRRRRHGRQSVRADRRGCRDGIDPHRRRRTAPAPATRASSGTPTMAVVAGRSSTRRPGRGCSDVLVMLLKLPL